MIPPAEFPRRIGWVRLDNCREAGRRPARHRWRLPSRHLLRVRMVPDAMMTHHPQTRTAR